MNLALDLRGTETGGTLSSANTRPDCLIRFNISLCSFDPGMTACLGEIIFLASKKFISAF